MGNRKKSNINRNSNNDSTSNSIKEIFCPKCNTIFYTYTNGRNEIKCPVCRTSVYSEGRDVK